MGPHQRGIPRVFGVAPTEEPEGFGLFWRSRHPSIVVPKQSAHSLGDDIQDARRVVSFLRFLNMTLRLSQPTLPYRVAQPGEYGQAVAAPLGLPVDREARDDDPLLLENRTCRPSKKGHCCGHYPP